MSRLRSAVPASRTRRLLRLGGGLTAAALALGVALTPGTASATTRSTPTMFGAAGPSKEVIEAHERVLGQRINGLRVYKDWDDRLFSGTQTWARDTGHTLFLSVNTKRGNGNGARWSEIARARPGDALYADMRDQAEQVKEFGAKVYLGFHHEPETESSLRYGNGDDFQDAWRTWVSVFRDAGVTNAEYVFTMTAWGFARSDERRAENYYPGDAFVDHIAADGYNWYRCREGDGKWRDLAAVIEAHRQFGQKHPDKGLMLWEFGSAEDRSEPGRKADWFRDATELFTRPDYSQYRAVLTWEGRAHNGKLDCGFDYLSSPSATRAWVDMATSPAYDAKRLP